MTAKTFLAKDVRFDANNLPSFTGDARCSMIERAIAKHEESKGKLSIKKKRRFIEAATLAIMEYERAIEDVLKGRAILFNGDGIIPSPARMREACVERDHGIYPHTLIVGKVAREPNDRISIG